MFKFFVGLALWLIWINTLAIRGDISTARKAIEQVRTLDAAK